MHATVLPVLTVDLWILRIKVNQKKESKYFRKAFKPGFYLMRFSCDGLFQKSSFCLNARGRNMP